MSEPIVKLDHEERALSRLVTQFREAENLKGYIIALLSEANAIECAMIETLEQRNKDTATGFTLDVIGELVGQRRELIDATALTYFGFVGAIGAGSFGDDNDPSIGARFRSDGEPTTGNRLLIDIEYRLFICIRILRNRTKGTIEELIEILLLILEDEVGQIVVTEGAGPAEFTVGIGTILSNNAKVFLKNTDLLLKPGGVRLNFIYEFPPINPFGFVGAPDTPAGFGVGTFASII